MGQVHVKEGYELYQIITDFGDPLEIFREGIQNSFDECASEIYVNVYEKQKLGGDSSLIIEIIDNGRGLSKKNIANFFDVANSTKVTDDFIPNSKTKHGYKGHGAKVFFNANEVLICSKTKQGEYWAAQLKNPIEQIADGGKLFYSECDNPDELNISLPEGWESGFMVRIISPRHFKTQHTRFKLNHIYLRDYCKWYTLAGTVETLYNQDLVNKDIKIYLSGLLRDEFVQKYNNQNICDPVPVFKDTTFGKYEELSLGHYFPPERTSDSSMKKYADSIGSNKPKYMFYSKLVYNEIVTTGSIAFRLIISLEGYETKRRYDLNLSRQGKASEEGTHTDGQRYGIWACKGGVPVEKVDDWIEGGRGVGTYTYMQAFIDCDDFQLTANRGSIMNTDIEKLDMIKAEVNKIFKSKTVKNAMQERLDWEELEKIEKSLEDDREDLQKSHAKIVGAEALVRWIDANGKCKSPMEFIPVFEANGFIYKLDCFMWEMVCKVIRRWLDTGRQPLPISVNVSRTYLQKEDVAGYIKNLIDKYQIPMELFQLEITETTENAESLSYINSLKQAGFILLMDDFGSGYSSLCMLKNTPFDVLKMDRQFLDECLDSKQGKTIISHVISMSNDLGLSIIAEGVENRGTADFLYDNGCSVSQGFYFSKPVSIPEFEHMLDEQQTEQQR